MLEGGRVAEEGRHEDLVARGGAYARLYAPRPGSTTESILRPVRGRYRQAAEPAVGTSVTLTCWLALPLSPLSSTTVSSTA